jgi:hypothetical protein
LSSIPEIVEALAAALEALREDIPDLQIYPYWLASATPPTIDIYPSDPFQIGMGFGPRGGWEMFFTVRARVTTADSDAGQQLLYQMLEPETGVVAALVADQTLGGVVDTLGLGEDGGGSGTSGLREYVEDVATNSRLLGAEWRVRVLT